MQDNKDKGDLYHTVQVDNDTVLLHPSQLGDVKKGLVDELYKKKQKWDDSLKGICTSITDIRLLNGGRGFIKDDMPHVHY